MEKQTGVDIDKPWLGLKNTYMERVTSILMGFVNEKRKNGLTGQDVGIYRRKEMYYKKITKCQRDKSTIQH